jgi:hypothetical protein
MIKKLSVTLGLFALSVFIAPTAQAATSLYYTFNSDGVLAESFPMESSSSKYFWLNSGGKLPIKGGVGGTLQGPLPANDYWRVLYGKNNPLDTGNGYYPQNLFRWVTRSTWTNISQELPFKITKMNLTDTPNRDGYSGVLLFARYASDGQTTYYAGVRQDGTPVIKKKYKGTYYTMSQPAAIFSNGSPYNKDTNPNLIPENKWMAIKFDVVNKADGTAALNLYLDQNYDIKTARNWKLVASATDAPNKYGSTPVLTTNYAGIRTDYMDVLFDNYRLTETQ